jgi:hypothetical protein
MANMIRTFSLFALCLFLSLGNFTLAQPKSQDLKSPDSDWKSLSLQIRRDRLQEKSMGWSYVVSGGIGFLGGLAGQEIAKDPFEKGAYTVFQSIGIAAIGYGLYRVYVGSEDQNFHHILETSDLSNEQKERLFRSYQSQKAELEKKEKRIRALTHGLIALLNINSASQQGSGVVKDSLYFIGGVNILACLSYSWDF